MRTELWVHRVLFVAFVAAITPVMGTLRMSIATTLLAVAVAALFKNEHRLKVKEQRHGTVRLSGHSSEFHEAVRRQFSGDGTFPS